MVTYERPTKIMVKSTAGMETYSTWTLHQTDGGGTEANFTIEAPLENWLIRRVSERFVRNQIRYAVDIALTNIKAIIEHDYGQRDKSDAATVQPAVAVPMPKPEEDIPRRRIV
jgi:hypothetical protein